MHLPSVLALVFFGSVHGSPGQITLSSPDLPLRNSNSILTPDFMLSATIDDLSSGLQNGYFSSVDLTRTYLNRMRRVSSLNAFLFENSYALLEANEADVRLSKAMADRTLADLPPLLGIPYALKGNIAAPPHVAPNTAGSFALLRTTARSSAVVEQQLRSQGAVLLGLTNLDEFAQSKSSYAPWGWSTLGGQMDSPFYPGGDICGSSGGSAIATSLGLAAFTLGTQTGWSITCPASRAGIVGFKPSPTAISRSGVIPISTHRDSVGPITRSVRDARLVYQTLSTKDSIEPTCAQRRWRIGVAENLSLMPVQGRGLVEMLAAQSRLIGCLEGLSNVDVHRINFTDQSEQKLKRLAKLDSSITVVHDFRLDMAEYLQDLHDSSGMHTLEDIRDWHKEHAALSLPPGPFPPDGLRLRQGILNDSYALQDDIDASVDLHEPIGPGNDTYNRVTDTASREALEDVLLPHFEDNHIDIVLSLSADGGALAQFQALTRAPMISVPLGFLSASSVQADGVWPAYPYPGMPYGIALSGRPGDDDDVLCFAEIVERITTKDWAGPGKKKQHIRPDVLASLKAAHLGNYLQERPS